MRSVCVSGAAIQLPLDLIESRVGCLHTYGFATHACVPTGFICCSCHELVLQWLPESPAVLGYLSADWAWHYRDGKPWTTLPRAGRT